MLRHLPKLTQLVSNRVRTRTLVGFIYLFSPQTPGCQLSLWFRGSEKLPPDLTGPWSLGPWVSLFHCRPCHCSCLGSDFTTASLTSLSALKGKATTWHSGLSQGSDKK